MLFLYNYQTIVRFTQAVNTHFIKLRCLPCVNACQKLLRDDFTIFPDMSIQNSKDAFGNRIVVGSSLEPHDSLSYISSGIVDLEEYCIPDIEPAPYYKIETTKTTYSPEMDVILVDSNFDTWLTAWTLCTELHKTMEYVPNSTDMNTTAAEAFHNRKGVCQDYAHILIALCRHRGIMARYVNGFISGEGETHGWVEVFVPSSDNLDASVNKGVWRALDPTHGNYVDYGYIKLAHGRDADDCPVSRGTYTGPALQQTEIRVIVNKI